MYKIRFLIVVPFILALALVAVTLAAARNNMAGSPPAVQGSVSNPPGSQAGTPGRSQPVIPVQYAGQSSRTPLQSSSQPAARSNSALMPGFLQNEKQKPPILPQAAPLQVDAQGRAVLPQGQGSGNFGGASPQSLQAGFTVDMAYNAVEGLLNPGDQVTVSVGTAYGAAVADASGFFWTPIWQPSGVQLDLTGGETIDIYVNGVFAITITPAALIGGIDVINDQVSGAISGAGDGVTVTAALGGWGYLPADGAPSGSAATGAGGVFTIAMPADLIAANLAQVDYQVSSGCYVRDYLRPEPSTFVFENLNLVAGYGQPGQDVSLTVYVGQSNDIRWQGSSTAGKPTGFYMVEMREAFAEIGDRVEVVVGGSLPMETTVANLHDITYNTAADLVSGTAPAGEEVLVNSFGWSGDTQTYMEVTATAGPSNAFAATLPGDLRPSTEVAIYLTDDNGNSTAIFGGAPYVEAMLDPTSNPDCVVGRVDAPDQPITLSLQTATGTYYRSMFLLSGAGNEINPPWYCYVIRDPDGNSLNFSPGDILSIESPTWSGSLTIADVSWQADTDNDLIFGSAPDGEVKVDLNRVYSEQYPAGGAAIRKVNATAGGFTASFSTFDVRDEDNVILRYYDPTSDFVTQIAGAGFGGIKVHYFIVYAPWGIYGSTPNLGEYVSGSLYDENGVLLATADAFVESWGFWLSDFQGNPFAPGYWITVTGESGWNAGYQIPELTMNVDETADLIWGEGPKDRLLIETGWGYNGFFPSDGYVLNTTALGHDLVWGETSNVFYFSPNGDRFVVDKRWPYLVAHYGPYTAGDHVWGNGADLFATVPVTVTEAGGAVLATANPQSNNTGDFDTTALPTGSIAPGNIVYANFGNGGVESVDVLPVGGEANPDTEIVTITAPVGTNFIMNADGRHGWWDSNWSNPDGFVVGPEGYVTVDLSVDGYDIVPGTYFNVHTRQYHGHNTQYTFWLPVLNIRINYGHDWVESNFEAGHTVWLTLTNSLGEVKATASGVTGPIEWWGGQPGFSTGYNVPWQGPAPDIQPTDWVYVRLDNGLTAESHIGNIDAVVDVGADVVNGVVNAPLTDPVWINCMIWQDGGPGIGFGNVAPNGGTFSCDFTGQWDILPGQTIAVSYDEPDGDQVINIAPNPAPRLRIQTWADGQPGAGSNFSLGVQYRNEGNAATQAATISAVLQGGLVYLGDTSGLPVSGSGTEADPLVWQLGTLEPNYNSDTRFYIFTQVTGVPGDPVTNTVQIENGTPYFQDNYWDKTSAWSGQVQPIDTDLTLTKGAWTWDPVPGSQFVYNVNVCNKGSTDSAGAVVTDTLPLSTTLVSWWAQMPGWVEVEGSPHQLVVSRLTYPGYRCSEVYLRVELDANAWEGMQLHNTAGVFTSNDVDHTDDWTDIWHNVGKPRANLWIDKQWNWGVLAPGGEIRYNINYRNDGNQPAANVVVTETLPVSTTFVGAFRYDDVGGYPFTPTLVTDKYVVWDIGRLDNGYGLGFEVILDIDPQAQPGLELVNTADISRLAGEDRYDDNTSTWIETLNDHGPNLRVRKYGDWHGCCNGHDAWYNIIVENIGDMPVNNVTVTDTLPISMVMTSDPGTDWSQVVGYTYNAAEGWFTMTFKYLHPNWRRDINVNLYNDTLPPEQVVPGGQFFTNQVEISQAEGEPNYADNFSQYTLGSGPDLYVEKSLIAGEPLPGAEVTFRLLFGNRQVGHAWWWNMQGSAWLTDTLPAATEFITSTQRWCGGGEWCPVDPLVQGDNLTWQLWPINTGNWNEIHLTVRLPDSLTGLDTVTNRAAIASDQPQLDLEPDYTNNTSIYQADVMLPFFGVAKTYASSAVAGMPVTYTLTADNSGHLDGSDVVVSDQLPADLTYASGGSYNAGTGEITWTLPGLGSGETADVEFVGQLSCQAGLDVLNDTYRVSASAEGVTSDWGALVSFSVITPTIEASFAASSLSVVEDMTVYFTGTAATDGTLLTYAWSFGDGGSAATLDASHAYSAAGSYDVTLTVTDACGYSAEYTLTVEVSAGTISVYLPVVRK